MLDLFIGVIISGLAEIFKDLKKKYGKQVTAFSVLGLTFLASLIYAFLKFNGFITQEMIESAVKIFSSAVTTYEVLTKRLIKPALEKVINISNN